MLQIDPSVMIFSVINFLVLVLILRIVLYKPVLRMLDARKEEIRNKFKEADEAREEARRLKEQSLQELQQAKAEAQNIINQAGILGNEAKEEIIADASAKAELITKKAQEEIRLAKEKAMTELRAEIAGIVVQAAEKVLGRIMQPEDQARLIEQFLSNLEAEINNLSISADTAKSDLEVEVCSAIELAPEQILVIENKLAALTGKPVRVKNTVNPGIIGGLILIIEDTVIDGSILKQMPVLKANLQNVRFEETGVTN